MVPLKGQVAQLVEQWTENPRVGGSIPPLATISLLKEPRQFKATIFLGIFFLIVVFEVVILRAERKV